MHTFQIKTYEIPTEKIKENREIRFAVLADLHGFLYGEENRELIQAIKAARPDAVLCVGDLSVRTKPETLEVAEKLLKSLVKEFPVYYALGNHEYKMKFSEFGECYEAYEKRLSMEGVRFLHNQKTSQKIGETWCHFYGLELPLDYYKKPKSRKLTQTELERYLGTVQGEGMHILLAHNPKYGTTYFSWGADLILSGHYHGGIVRLSEHCGLTCPQYLLFPPYCCGDFHRGNRHMVVSAGLGEHTIPVRIHNKRELLIISLKQREDAYGNSR